MRTPRFAFLLVLLAGAVSAQQSGSTSYTPVRRTDAPTFMNAEVVRVDRASNRVTFRSASRDTTLTVEGEALTAIAGLHSGDKVVVGYRVVKDAEGREVRYVTSVKPASPTSGEPGDRRIAAKLAAGQTVRARVLSYDRPKRRVTVIDETGGLRSIPVTRGVTDVTALVPGANVGFNLGAAGTGVNVTGITSLGDTPVFANGVAFPPVNGRLVSFNQRTGLVTLDTPTAGRVTFPAGTTVASGFGGLRPGDNLSLNVDVTTAARQAQTGVPAGSGTRIQSAGTPVGMAQPLVTITGVQPLVTGAPAVQAAGVPGAVSPIAPNTASPNAPGLSGGQVVGGVATGGQTSPLLNPIPSISGGSPVQAAVLSPAVAKAPLSAEDVGAMRLQGEADLDNAAMALAASANAIDPIWSGYKSQCLRGFTAERASSGREWYLLAEGRIMTPADDACRALFADLTTRAQGFIQQLDTVEDAARKADVLPARVREVFERHRLR